jgi:hypothetical protein
LPRLASGQPPGLNCEGIRQDCGSNGVGCRPGQEAWRTFPPFGYETEPGIGAGRERGSTAAQCASFDPRSPIDTLRGYDSGVFRSPRSASPARRGARSRRFFPRHSVARSSLAPQSKNAGALRLAGVLPSSAVQKHGRALRLAGGLAAARLRAGAGELSRARIPFGFRGLDGRGSCGRCCCVGVFPGVFSPGRVRAPPFPWFSRMLIGRCDRASRLEEGDGNSAVAERVCGWGKGAVFSVVCPNLRSEERT